MDPLEEQEDTLHEALVDVTAAEGATGGVGRTGDAPGAPRRPPETADRDGPGHGSVGQGSDLLRGGSAVAGSRRGHATSSPGPSALLERFNEKRRMRERQSCFERLKNKVSKHWHSLRTPKEEEGLDFDPQYSKLYTQRESEMTSSTRQMMELMQWVIALVIAIIVSTLAIVVDISIEHLSKYKFDGVRGRMREDRVGTAAALYFFGNLAFVGLATLLVAFLDVRARGSGVPEIKSYLNGRKIHRVIAVRTLFSKLLGVIMSVSGSLILGKEGPMVHAGGVVGAVVSQGRSEHSWFGIRLLSFRSDHYKRAFVSIGCACGIAAAFSAPLGGVLFVIEEAASYWSVKLTWITFFAAMVCAATVDVFVSALVEDAEWGLMSQSAIVSFGSFEGASRDVCYPRQPPYRVMEIPLFILVGIFGGLAGVVFNKFNLWISKLRLRFVTSPVVRVCEALVVSLVTSGVLFGSTFLYPCRSLEDLEYTDPALAGRGYNGTCSFMQPDGNFCDSPNEVNDLESLMINSMDGGVKHLFHSKVLFENGALVIYFLGLYLLACITYGTSIPSGLFVPAIAMGAAAGRLMGQQLYSLTDNKSIDYFGPIDPGIYALIGGAATLGGITRMTISIVVILIETTNNSTYAVPIMITIMTAKVVGDLFTDGLYDMHIKLQRILFLHDEPHPTMHNVQVRECMNAEPIVVNVFVSVADVLEKLESNPTINGFPVVSHLCKAPGSHPANQPALQQARALRSIRSLYDPENRNFGALAQQAEREGRTNRSDNTIEEEEEDIDESQGNGIFEGVILRSQLMILLYERVFKKPQNIFTEPDEPVSWRRMYAHYPRYPSFADVVERLDEGDLNKVIDLRPYLNSGALTVHHSVYMSRVHQLFRLMGIRHLTVVNTQNSVVGIVTRADIHRLEHELDHRPKSAGGVGSASVSATETSAQRRSSIGSNDPDWVSPRHVESFTAAANHAMTYVPPSGNGEARVSLLAQLRKKHSKSFDEFSKTKGS